MFAVKRSKIGLNGLKSPGYFPPRKDIVCTLKNEWGCLFFIWEWLMITESGMC